MTRSQITIIDPQSELSPLVLEWFEHDGGYQRGYVPARTSQGFNPRGCHIKAGPIYGSLYSWAFSVDAPLDDALLLQDYFALQGDRDYLLFTDHYEHVSAIESQTRTVFSSEVVGSTTGYFCTFKVWIQPAANPLVDRGYSSSRDLRWKRISFTAIEIPEAVV